MCYMLTDLCSLLSDNGRLLGVLVLLAAKLLTLLANIVLSSDAFKLEFLEHRETELLLSQNILP